MLASAAAAVPCIAGVGPGPHPCRARFKSISSFHPHGKCRDENRGPQFTYEEAERGEVTCLGPCSFWQDGIGGPRLHLPTPQSAGP